jgi:hypothetical protein
MRRTGWTRIGPSLLVGAGIWASVIGASSQPAYAQVTAWNDQNQHRSGQFVSPVYEGWYKGEDGLVRAVFGYINRNTEEHPNVPVGADNQVQPGAADQGQPTYFLPGRHYGVFVVTLPKDRSTTEVTWTLTVHGRTMAIPASLDPVYVIETLKTMGTNNEPPRLKFAADGPAAVGPGGPTVSLTTTTAKPLSLDVWVTDETIPPGKRSPTPGAPGSGLSVGWSKFRGAGAVKFSNPSPAIQQNKATTTVSFAEPGDYTLKVVASDGSGFSSQCCWTNAYVNVKVEAARP